MYQFILTSVVFVFIYSNRIYIYLVFMSHLNCETLSWELE